jgi:hypothetical protein
VEYVGFSPLETITCATKTGAEIMGRGDEFGTLEAGKLADVLVVDGDVVADISVLEDRTRSVAVIQGRIVKAGRLVAEGRAMTEAEWLAGDKPRPMLNFMSDRITERKARLFAVAKWRSTSCPRFVRAAVDLCERYADGEIDAAILQRHEEEAWESWKALDRSGDEWGYGNVAVCLLAGSDRLVWTQPVLADALQDAGCDNASVLDHCRDLKATHVRGCWVVDLVLGKT